MTISMNRNQFEESIIAQDDDCDWSESGYVAGRFNGVCFIARYSHCSCYGTWEDISGDSSWSDDKLVDVAFDWIGTLEQLIEMAEKCLDPAMPDRPADPEDYDFDHLTEVYKTIKNNKEMLLHTEGK